MLRWGDHWGKRLKQTREVAEVAGRHRRGSDTCERRAWRRNLRQEESRLSPGQCGVPRSDLPAEGSAPLRNYPASMGKWTPTNQKQLEKDQGRELTLPTVKTYHKVTVIKTVQFCHLLLCSGRVWLFATPWTVAHQAPLSMGFSRQEYWSGLLFPSPGDLPNSGIEPTSPA